MPISMPIGKNQIHVLRATAICVLDNYPCPLCTESLLENHPDLNIEEHRSRLRLFLESLYFDNEAVFQLKLCFLHAAFKKACTGKMMFEVGKGGDGKGMEAYLEKAMLGEDESATLDWGDFLDRQEFRKSAEFAWNKANVRIQEMDQHARFIADLWKCFVVDEEVDCRVNYGFTTKRRFGSSMKIQEMNYENIPVIEEGRDRLKACEQLKRRVVCCRMGKARFVLNDTEVDPARVVSPLIPQDELVPFLSHLLAASIFFCEWCLPFFQENTIEECLGMILIWLRRMSLYSLTRSGLLAGCLGGMRPLQEMTSMRRLSFEI